MRFTTKVSLEDPGEVEAVLGRVQVLLYPAVQNHLYNKLQLLQGAAQERLQGSNFVLNRNSEGELKVESVIVQVAASTQLVLFFKHCDLGGTQWRGGCEGCASVLGLH